MLTCLLYTDVISLFATRTCQRIRKAKIVNIEGENLHIFWTTWGISMMLSGKMWFIIILKITKRLKKTTTGFHPFSGKYVFEKTAGVVKLIPLIFLELSGTNAICYSVSKWPSSKRWKIRSLSALIYRQSIENRKKTAKVGKISGTALIIERFL